MKGQRSFWKTIFSVIIRVLRFGGRLAQFVMLGVIFYVFFGLIGFFLRIIGKDLLARKFERSTPTYWKSSRCAVFDRETMTSLD